MTENFDGIGSDKELFELDSEPAAARPDSVEAKGKEPVDLTKKPTEKPERPNITDAAVTVDGSGDETAERGLPIEEPPVNLEADVPVEAPVSHEPEAELDAPQAEMSAGQERTPEVETGRQPQVQPQPQHRTQQPYRPQQPYYGAQPPAGQYGYGYRPQPYYGQPYRQDNAYRQPQNAPYGQGPNMYANTGYGAPPYGAYNAPVVPQPPVGIDPSQGPSPYLADRAPQDKPPKKSKKGVVIVSIIVVIAILAAVAGIIWGASEAAKGLRNIEETEQSETEIETDDGEASTEDSGNKPKIQISDGETLDALSVSNIVEKLESSNVGVVIYTPTNTIYGQGSGIVMTEDGYILTSAHVISDAEDQKIRVVFRDKAEHDARIIGYDERSDVGILKVDDKNDCVPAEFGDSNALAAGDPVIAIGNPGGLSFFGSVTTGVVSCIDRPISSEIGYSMKCIQHSAAISPGNSGGMLANSRGQVVGINSSKISSTEYESMSFAVPVSDVKDIIDGLIENGYVKDRAKLSISYVPAKSNYYYNALATAYGLPDGTVVIASINSDSDLNNYDVKQYDMIVAVNGQELTEAGQLVDAINGMKPGDNIKLKLVRIDTDTNQKSEFEVTCKLIEDTGSSKSVQQQIPNGGGNQSEIF